MMAIQGLRDSSNFVANARPKNWREGIMLLYPNGKMPFMALTSLMKKRSVDDPEFNWWEKGVQTRRIALSANLTLVNTAVGVTSGALAFKEGDLFWVENTTEVVYVSADPTADTGLTVIRGFGGTTAATVDFDGNGVNPNLLCIGSAYEEGSLAPTGVAFDPSKKFNYTQIFRDALEATRTGMKTRLRTGDQVKEAKRECLEVHGMAMERAFWSGIRYEGTRNGKPWRSMGGIQSFIDSNNIKTADSDYAGGVTMLGLEEYLYEMFRYGSNEKLGICGNRALLALQQIVRKNSTWQIQSGLKEFGMNVTRLTCPFGELVLKSHPMFNQVTGGTTGTAAYYGMESWLFALDMDDISYVHLDGSDTTYEKKLEANGMDGKKSGYLTEASIEVHHPTAHYLIKNLHTAAADA
jgi:hypothetical protein